MLRPGHHRHVQREAGFPQAINAWNKEYRWSRAYLDEKNQAVLQMDVNAEGAIGKENLQILLNTFISIAEDFSAMVNKGAGK